MKTKLKKIARKTKGKIACLFGKHVFYFWQRLDEEVCARCGKLVKKRIKK